MIAGLWSNVCGFWEEGRGEQFQKAYHFLKNRDWLAEKPGVIAIDGEKMYAVVQEYDTENMEQLQYESHKRYLDVQYLVSGQEKILVCDRQAAGEIVIPYNPNEDIVFYADPEEEPVELLISAGEFAVFTTEDCHKTRCNVRRGAASPVKKVIIKIQIQSRRKK